MKKKFILAFLIMTFIIPSVDFALAENKRDDDRTPVTTTTTGDIDPENTVVCADITRNLRYGSKDTDTNTDVSILQDFLIERGYMKGSTTGFFGKGTFTGVRAFQKKNDIFASGFVGAVTRAKIKAIDCIEIPEKPTIDPQTNEKIELGIPTRLYKDRVYKISDINYKLTITGFYNHPCPQGSMCIWSGLDMFYRLDPISGKGPSYAKTEINQNTDKFPVAVIIKDSDYTNFAEVTIEIHGQNTHIIDSLPGSGDHK